MIGFLKQTMRAKKMACDRFRKWLIPWTAVAYLRLGQNDIVSATNADYSCPSGVAADLVLK